MGNYNAAAWSMKTSGAFLRMSAKESITLKPKKTRKGNEKKEINIGNGS